MNQQEQLKKWSALYTFEKDGWFNFTDFYDFVCQEFTDGSFVEIGSWCGMSLAYLMLKSNSKVTVWSVDTFKGDPNNPREQQLIRDGKLDLLKILQSKFQQLELKPNLIIKDSVEASKAFNNQEMSFVFIDAGHHYEQVIKDINAWMPKVKPGGILAGHDYPAPGVNKAVKSLFKKHNTMGDCWWVRI